MIRLSSALLVLAAFALPARADWRPIEQVEPYSISGQTGIALYESIGERGPKVGIGRAVAYTNFKLTWSRDYVPQPDGSCVLRSARPRLVIIYALPKPSQKLPAAVKRSWDVFHDGVARHERVHGDMIVEMVRKIEAVSVGLTAPNDPDCKKVRASLQQKLGPLSQEQRRQSRDFDRREMSDGGNIHQLILQLVNGP